VNVLLDPVVELCPEAVTTTGTAPAAPAGEVARHVVEAQLTAVAGFDPNVTEVAPGTKLVPLIVTTVPPAVGPLAGLTELTTGAAASGAGVE
jgi:hypothetical protein